MEGLVNFVTNSLTTKLDQKAIRITITLIEDGSEIVIQGLKARVDLIYGNGAIMPSAFIKIYNFDIKAMQKLIRIRWVDITSMQNQIKIEAGNQGDTLTTVYQGNITFANIDTPEAPDIGLSIQSITAVYDAYNPATPLSFKGERPVVEVMQEIAEGMEYQFTNNDVPAGLLAKDVTLNDTGINKLRKLARDYEIDLYLTFSEVIICRRGSPRQTKIPVLNSESGLIGYPSSTQQGIEFRCLYNEAVQFGGIVEIENSVISACNGQWRVFGVNTILEAETPGGIWFMDVKATWPEASNVAISR